MTRTPSGDVPVNIEAHCFTLPDAVYLTGVPELSLRNWLARKTVGLGNKDRLTGRWLFSVLDALKFRVMYALSVRKGMDVGPRNSAIIADMAANAARENLRKKRDGYRPNINVIVAWDENGEMFCTTADIKHPGNYYPPLPGGDEHPLREPIICIPCAVMLHDLIIATEALQERNRTSEGPVHV